MIRTVLGAVAGDAVSAALPLERVLCRIDAAEGRAAAGTDSAVRVEELQSFRRDPWFRGGANLRLEKEDDAFRELEPLLELAVGDARPLVVDVTLPCDARDAFTAQRVRLAEKLGLHLVMSATYDAPIQGGGEGESEQIAKTLETELVFGIGAAADARASRTEGAAVCAGVVYQRIRADGTDLGPLELTLARGLALAQQRTHAPLYLSFSTSHEREAGAFKHSVVAWLRSLIELGAERRKLVVCHADQWCQDGEDGGDSAFLLGLFELGVTVLFDMIGLATVSDVMNTRSHSSGASTAADGKEPPRDSAIAKWIARFVLEHDRVDQILVSTNVHQRVQYRRHGGGGYAFLFAFFKPRLLRLGVSEAQWATLVRANPVALLSWYSPPEAPEIPKHYIKCSICRRAFEPIEGEYFTKFAFVYCGTKCLRRHSRLQFVDPPPAPASLSNSMSS